MSSDLLRGSVLCFPSALKRTLRRNGFDFDLNAARTGGSSGDDRIRTGDLLLAKQALYQLSYIPEPLP
jgi:hypothetical protein